MNYSDKERTTKQVKKRVKEKEREREGERERDSTDLLWNSLIRMHTTTPPGTASRSTEAEETTAITTITSGNTKIALPTGTETQKMIQQKEQYHQHQEQENQQHKHRQQQISNIKKRQFIPHTKG